jgi:hypothetical protein
MHKAAANGQKCLAGFIKSMRDLRLVQEPCFRNGNSRSPAPRKGVRAVWLWGLGRYATGIVEPSEEYRLLPYAIFGKKYCEIR